MAAHVEPARDHHTSFKPNCRLRGVSALVIVPNVAVPSVAPACPNRGVLVNANASNRNWSRSASRNQNSLCAEKSQLKNPRCRSTFRPSLPNTYGGVATKSAALKSMLKLRVNPVYGSPIRLGRLTMLNVPVFAGLPELMTLYGRPLARVTILPTDQPPNAAFTARGSFPPKRRPAPNGSS